MAHRRRPVTDPLESRVSPVSAGDQSGSLVLSGTFSLAEREFLASQFSRCHIELLRRASRNPSVAVIVWHATEQTFNRRGPGPLLGTSMPRRAVYVLQVEAMGTQGDAQDDRPAPDNRQGGRLVRIQTQLDLEREIGERDEAIDLGGAAGPVASMWEGTKRALRGLVPWQPNR